MTQREGEHMHRSAAAMPATAGGETMVRRPTGLHVLWRLATTLGKAAGRDPAAAIGQTARLETVLRAAEIAPYAEICGFEDGAQVPITYPHMLAFPLHTRIMMRDAFPFPMMGAIHLENSIEALAPLAPDDRLAIEARVSGLFRHVAGQAVEILSIARRDGEIVWESRSLYLFRGAGKPVGGAFRSRLVPGAAEGGLQERTRWNLPASIGRRYAMVSGDWNPIHLSRVTARLFGQRKSIAHGMWMKARSVAAITASPLVVPLLASHRIASVTVAFRTPAFLPGAAALFQGVRAGRDNHFEVRDAQSPRRLLRGHLRLEAI